jgi:succinate dehydrogenase hydrophobic anchor subunit
MTTENLKPKLREGTWLWLLKIVGGLLIVIVLGIHFVVNHLVAPGGLLTYADVISYYKNPLIPIMEVGFLVLAIGHSF